MNNGETNIVGAICARGGSKGIPRKNLRPLAGKPLIAHAIQCARACSLLRRVVVSTDDPAIADIAKEHGAEVPFIRPADLAQDDTHCVTQLLSGDADLVVTAYEADRNPYFNMVEVNGEGLAKIVKPSERPIVCRQEAPRVYSLSPAVYAIRRHALWQYEHWSEAKFQIYPLARERAIDIDSELDFHLVEFLMQQQQRERDE